MMTCQQARRERQVGAAAVGCWRSSSPRIFFTAGVEEGKMMDGSTNAMEVRQRRMDDEGQDLSPNGGKVEAKFYRQQRMREREQELKTIRNTDMMKQQVQQMMQERDYSTSGILLFCMIILATLIIVVWMDLSKAGDLLHPNEVPNTIGK
jgi:hypothetical protein